MVNVYFCKRDQKQLSQIKKQDISVKIEQESLF